jgi:hypothetical protein
MMVYFQNHTILGGYMSSTKGNVNKDDYYATPEWIVREFFKEFDEKVDKDWWIYSKILDPAAGGCSKHGSTYPDVMKDMYGFNDISIDTIDIREDSLADVKCDYLTVSKPSKLYNMIITNPPFSLSVAFAEKAITEVVDGGYVILLQRLNWLGTQKRKTFWDNMPLHSAFVHHKRPSFHGTSGTDSIEYAHFVFKKGYIGSPTLYII